MKTKHTPGPWRVERSDEYTFQYAITKSGGKWVTGLEGGEEEANRRLIEAAPELLAALQSMVGLLNSSEGQRHRKQAFSAIAKATGGAA